MHGSLGLTFLLILICIFAFSVLSKAISKTMILTLPIVFTGVGYLFSQPLEMLAEPAVLDSGKRLIAEITLIFLLFSDASHVRLRKLRQNFGLPSRMLVIGLPLTIALGTIATYFTIPGTAFGIALLTAAVLTPTDAALGQSVVTSPKLPDYLRQTINVESGLNDGLVLPFVLFGAILASAGMEGAQTDGLATLVILQIVFGPLAGLAVGWLSAQAMNAARAHDLMPEAAGGVAFLSVALAAYIGSEAIGGNGFISAFVAGMVFGNVYRHDIHFISEFMEGVGQLLTMFSFLIFGALLLPAGLTHASWHAAALGLMFLTVVRMLPIWISLIGTGLKLQEKLFLGWFGPRGLASILFTLIMIDEFDFPREQELLSCVSMTVFLSIILHGMSATPLSNWVGRTLK